jgi:polar amino acid transport system substrate-binding protein
MSYFFLKYIKNKAIIVISVLLFLFMSFVTYAENIEITVGVDEWVPFRIMNEEEYKGIDFDLWKIIEERLNIKVKFERYPWGRSLYKLSKGEIDAMSGVAYTSERAIDYIYSDIPYFTCSPAFYIKRGSGVEIEDYDTLYKLKSIGMVIGSAYFLKFDNDKRLNKIEVATEVQLLKMLNSDRVETIIGTGCQVDYEIRKMNLQRDILKASYIPENSVDLYIVFSKKSSKKDIIYDINKLLLELKESKEIEKIEKKYF